ncbi:MAG: DUF5343 domain-containing protein [Hyphomonadaceae bacterium]|nr:DUF5343 domain-containing protein [Hyphomonadaceae bacterium]
MADDTPKITAAYAPWRSFINFIMSLVGKPIPRRIDRSVFGNMNGGLAYSILSALRFLKLIDAEGRPTALLEQLVAASDADRPAALLNVLKAGYEPFWDGSFDLKTATAAQFNELLRDRYGASGSTIDKAAAFFLGAAEEAGVEVSDYIKKRTSVGPSPSSRKSAKARRVAAEASAFIPAPPVPPPAPPAATSLPDQLVGKYPPFDPAWPPEIQKAWFDGFQKLMEITRSE